MKSPSWMLDGHAARMRHGESGDFFTERAAGARPLHDPHFGYNHSPYKTMLGDSRDERTGLDHGPAANAAGLAG